MNSEHAVSNFLRWAWTGCNKICKAGRNNCTRWSYSSNLGWTWLNRLEGQFHFRVRSHWQKAREVLQRCKIQIWFICSSSHFLKIMFYLSLWLPWPTIKNLNSYTEMDKLIATRKKSVSVRWNTNIFFSDICKWYLWKM